MNANIGVHWRLRTCTTRCQDIAIGILPFKLLQDTKDQVPNVTPTRGRFQLPTHLPGAVSSKESSDPAIPAMPRLVSLCSIERN